MQTSDASNSGYPPWAMNIKKMSFVPRNVNSTTVDTVTRPDASFGFNMFGPSATSDSGPVVLL